MRCTAFVRALGLTRFTRTCKFFGCVGPSYSQLASVCVHRLMYLRRIISWFQMCPMANSRHLSTWISCETKRRFANAAARQNLSESALSMAHLLQQDARRAVPGRQEVQAMLQVCEALRDHFRALIKANLISWDIGHAEQNH